MKDYNFKINGNDYFVSIDKIDDVTAELTVNGTPFHVEFEGNEKPKTQKFTQVDPIPASANTARPTPAASSPAKPAAVATTSAGESPIKSPLPGVILDIQVKVGDVIKEGQRLMILEAMKMENNIDSDRSGTVKSVKVNRGDSVLEGDVLITLE